MTLLITMGVRADLAAMVHTLGLAGWKLLWLIPFRGIYFVLYAIGWFKLLQPYDAGRAAGLGYVLWATTVREGIDRLLPVAGIGGGVAGVRLLRWRGLGAVAATTSVLIEVFLTVIVLYIFTALGLLLLLIHGAVTDQVHRLWLGFLFSLPVPLVTAALLRYGSVFSRLQRTLGGWAGLGTPMQDAANALDHELRASLRRVGALTFAGSLQLVAWISGAFEVWIALRLFGHPVGVSAALILESTLQAMRHLAFIVPAGLGVQEAGLVLFGHVLGISEELALAVSMAKRMRELLCGLPPLLSWQWLEGRRFKQAPSRPV